MSSKQDGSRAIWSWALYDFANSPFTTLVVTFVYATYFTQAIAPDPITGTVLWSRAVALTAVVVAVCLGASACSSEPDYGHWVSGDAIDSSGEHFTWPFTVDEGYLRCEQLGVIVFTTMDGQEYAVTLRAVDMGYPRPEPIWKLSSDPGVASVGAGESLADVIDLGNRLCD